jgi:hypothetical protein
VTDLDVVTGAFSYTGRWIRFEHRGSTFAQAVENTRTLFAPRARPASGGSST